VRDLLREQAPLDLDLVLAGDARALGAELARDYRLEAVPYPAFGTSTLRLTGALAPPPPASPELNLVTARRETYPAPAALPVVTPGTLADDLARRDFTINTLALPLDPPGGPLLDPHGGQADLAAGIIRVLHDRSFTDDPTRIFRAVRYEQRFGYTIEPHTLDLLRAEVAAGGIARLSGARIRNELLRILDEAAPAPVLARLDTLRVLAAVHPALRWGDDEAADMQQLREVFATELAGEPASSRRQALLAAWLGRGDPAATAAVAARLHLARATTGLIVELARARAALPPLLARPPARPSELARLLRPYPLPALRLLQALTRDATVRRQIALYRAGPAAVRPRLTGADLQALGVPRGPAVGRLLGALRDARLDGLLPTRAAEEQFVHRGLNEGMRNELGDGG
jgi:tRNA nucleotidyltransferase (CCA-adding enzyme)